MLIKFRFNDAVYKSISIFFSLLLIFPVTATAANEQSNDYFPHTPGSFWVYADQDGDKLTRRAVAEKTIEGETYHAFSYEPTWKSGRITSITFIPIFTKSVKME